MDVYVTYGGEIPVLDEAPPARHRGAYPNSSPPQAPAPPGPSPPDPAPRYPAPP